MQLLLKLLPGLDRYAAMRTRHHFFQCIADNLTRPPGAIDLQFGHAKFYQPCVVQAFGLEDNSLIVQVNPTVHGKKCTLFYSIWVTGDFIRIGVVMDNEAALAPVLEGQQEINHIWPDKVPETQDRDGSLMYQWSFEVPGLLERWTARDLFVDGIRHMHFRILRILHDGLAPSSSAAEDYNSD